MKRTSLFVAALLLACFTSMSASAQPINVGTLRATVLTVEADCIFCSPFSTPGCFVTAGVDNLVISLPEASGYDCLDNLATGDCLQVTGTMVNEGVSPGFSVSSINLIATSWIKLSTSECSP